MAKIEVVYLIRICFIIGLSALSLIIVIIIIR